MNEKLSETKKAQSSMRRTTLFWLGFLLVSCPFVNKGVVSSDMMKERPEHQRFNQVAIGIVEKPGLTGRRKNKISCNTTS